jgi:succinate dehydrogenase / fumarate reductase cytochrome b subunit
MGWKHRKYAGTIESVGVVISILLPLIFALMPIFMYLDIEIPIGNLTLFF